VEVIAEGLPSGKVSLSGSVSSQYLTALLMAAPLSTGSGARSNLAALLDQAVLARPAATCWSLLRSLPSAEDSKHC
jgi:hypothetical protein